MCLYLTQEMPPAWLKGGLGLGTQRRFKGNRDNLGSGGRAGVRLASEEICPSAPGPWRLGPARLGEEAGPVTSLCSVSLSAPL